MFVSVGVFAQQEESKRELGHTNNNKFKQLYDEFFKLKRRNFHYII